jgi:hypothetical protein
LRNKAEVLCCLFFTSGGGTTVCASGASESHAAERAIAKYSVAIVMAEKEVHRNISF